MEAGVVVDGGSADGGSADGGGAVGSHSGVLSGQMKRPLQQEDPAWSEHVVDAAMLIARQGRPQQTTPKATLGAIGSAVDAFGTHIDGYGAIDRTEWTAVRDPAVRDPRASLERIASKVSEVCCHALSAIMPCVLQCLYLGKVRLTECAPSHVSLLIS